MKELKQTRIIYLISGYLNHALTPDEIEELDKWRNDSPANAQLFEELSDTGYRNKAIADWSLDDTESSLVKLRAKRINAPRRKKLWWPYAAAMSLLLATGIYYYQRVTVAPHEQIVVADDVSPGSSKAILRLADGSTIELDATGKGTIARQAGINIVKSGDGSIIYQTANASIPATDLHNTIEIPKGGQYLVHLPDGSAVWLNAASTLKYPVSFNNHRERRVELSGEAYFEIAKDKKHPFIVKTRGQEVEVLGTHFNINSYADERLITTTLEEGSVRVSANGNGKTIRPGEQTLYDGKQLNIQQADIKTALAWKNGRIYFRDADIESIMRQVARWYDVEVVYHSPIPQRKFDGGVSRRANLSEVLKILELNGLHFKLENENGHKRLVLP